MKLRDTLIQIVALDLKTGHLFGDGRHVVGLVKDDDRVVIINVEVFANFLINEVVVGHEDEVCARDTILGCVVRAIIPLEGELVHFLDIHRLPRHVLPPIVLVFEVGARIDAFLGSSTRCVQPVPFVNIDVWVDAKMVA